MKSAQYIINREALLGFICNICNNMVYSNCFHAWLNTHTDKRRVYECGGSVQSEGDNKARVWQEEFEMREKKRKKPKQRERKVSEREGWIKESASFSTWGGIDAILEAATYEQVCCVWGLWLRLHSLHGFTSDWGASELGGERQASTPLRTKMKGQQCCNPPARTRKVRGTDAALPSQDFDSVF